MLCFILSILGLSCQGTCLAPISEEISVFTKQRPTLVSRNLEGLDLSPHVPQLPANSYRLRYSLASEQQMKETGTVIAGKGAKKAFDDAPRIIAQYGGKPEDWVKKSSSVYKPTDGNPFRTHWIENLQTGKRIEFKIKLKEKQ